MGLAKPRFRRLIKSGGSHFFRASNSLWYCRDLTERCPILSAGSSLRVDISDTEGTLDWLRTFSEPWMYNPKEIEVGLREEHFFPNIKLQGQIIGYSKIGIRRVFIDDFQMSIFVPDRIAFLYHIYVLQEYRKKDVAKQLLTAMLHELKKRGYKKIFCHIEKWNKPSIRLFESIGFRRIADITFFKIFCILRIWRTRSNSIGQSKFSIRMPNVWDLSGGLKYIG